MGTNTVASQSSSVGSRRSARRNSRSAARSSWSQNAIRTGPSCGGRWSGVAPGRSTTYSAGKIRCISSRVASKEALRASRRPKNSSTKRRATWVESTRSAGAWNVPMLSEREWRSATDDALGANGSWTWTNSIGATVSASSIVREMSSGGAGIAPRRAPASGSSSPTPSTRTPPSGSNSSPARIRRRDSRTRPGSSDGASTTTRWPTSACSAASARTNALTSCSSSHGYGVT